MRTLILAVLLAGISTAALAQEWRSRVLVPATAPAESPAASAASQPAAAPAANQLTAPAAAPPAPEASAAPAQPILPAASGESLVGALGGAYAPCVQQVTGGQIDWTRGVITATGSARAAGPSEQAMAMARRGARVVAARNALLLMQGIHLDAAGRTPEIEAGDVAVRGVLDNFEECATSYDPKTQQVSVSLRANLYGSRGVVRKCQPISPQGPKWQPTTAAPPSEPAEVVVVDARGTRFSPMLFPSLQNGKGQRVFDCGDVDSRQLRRRAMAAYAVHREGPPAPPQRRLLTLKAAARNQGGLVLDEAATAKVASDAQVTQLMKAGRMVIVVDEWKSKSEPVKESVTSSRNQ